MGIIKIEREVVIGLKCCLYPMIHMKVTSSDLDRVWVGGSSPSQVII